MGFFPDHDRLPSSPYKAYLEESQTPYVSLVFTLPFFLFYHLGVFTIATPDQGGPANGADVMIARALSHLGVGGPLISFVFVLVVFLFLQQYSGRPFRCRPGTLALMALESLVFALPPFALGALVYRAVQQGTGELLASAAVGGTELYEYGMLLVLSAGAGVYEEFLFRMLLMMALLFLFQRGMRLKGLRPVVAASLLQALVFALFHHLPGTGEPLTLDLALTPDFLQTFGFRVIAGVYFAYLYLERGFGIAAGSHAFYDIMAVTLIHFGAAGD